MNEKTYYLDENGTITEQSPEKETFSYAIFIYDAKNGEDINKIVGEAPLTYRDARELSKQIGRNDIECWLNQNYTIVIRPVKIVDRA